MELINAAIEGNLDKVKVLIKQRADINAENNNGKSVLMFASEKAYLDIFKYLVEKGADINAKDNDNRTVLDYYNTYREFEEH